MKQKVIDLKRVQEIRKRLNENIAGIEKAYPNIEDDRRRVKAYQMTAGEFPKSFTETLIKIAQEDDANLLGRIEAELGLGNQDEKQ